MPSRQPYPSSNNSGFQLVGVVSRKAGPGVVLTTSLDDRFRENGNDEQPKLQRLGLLDKVKVEIALGKKEARASPAYF